MRRCRKSGGADGSRLVWIGFAKRFAQLLCTNSLQRPNYPGTKKLLSGSELYYLPFEALIDSRQHFLVETSAIAYAPSPSPPGLLKRDHPNDGRWELAGIGAPALPEASSPADDQTIRGVYERAGFRFPPLPHAAEELTQIAGMFPAGQSKLWLGNQATAVIVRTAKLSDYRRIHFATHTVFDERSPERTGIVLTPAPKDVGILRPRDILKLHLDADLVVLSACQTGLGKLVRGGGNRWPKPSLSLCRCPTYRSQHLGSK
jgi:CHAT domain-containing protein